VCVCECKNRNFFRGVKNSRLSSSCSRDWQRNEFSIPARQFFALSSAFISAMKSFNIFSSHPARARSKRSSISPNYDAITAEGKWVGALFLLPLLSLLHLIRFHAFGARVCRKCSQFFQRESGGSAQIQLNLGRNSFRSGENLLNFNANTERNKEREERTSELQGRI
jgi:hypothetical protein